MEIRQTIKILAIAMIIYSCNNSKKDETVTAILDKSPVVAKKTTHHGDSLFVCDISLLKDTIDLPLSFLISDFDAIILDNREEALVTENEGGVEVSDNYIGIHSSTGYKLFDRDGKYITTLSSRGQGPNEYLISVYDSYIDEVNNCVYLLPMMSKNILTYDLQGNAQKSIPLAFYAGKGRFCVNTQKKYVYIAILPFNNDTPIFWKQDFDGNVLQKIAPKHLIISPPDYSNEINVYQNTEQIDLSFYHWTPRADTLYHYQEKTNGFLPIFTAKFADDVIQHDYVEIPNHYLIRLVQPSYQYSYILVDKKTLKGSYIRLKIDVLGNISGTKWIEMNKGYFIANMYTYELKEQLSRVNINYLSSKTQKIVQQLLNNLGEDGEDDNNVILIGKLKQNPDEIFRMSEPDDQQPLYRRKKIQSNVEIISNSKHEIAQDTIAKVKEQSDNDRIYYFKDLKEIKETPVFKETPTQYFRNNNRYKDWNINDKKEVVLEYIVEKDGTASNIKIRKSSNNTDLDEEAIRLIKEAKHLPGTNLQGEYIRCGNTIITVFFPPK